MLETVPSICSQDSSDGERESCHVKNSDLVLCDLLSLVHWSSFCSRSSRDVAGGVANPESEKQVERLC